MLNKLTNLIHSPQQSNIFKN